MEMEMEMGEVLGRRMGGGMVIGWLGWGLGREMRKRGGTRGEWGGVERRV